MFNWGSRSPGPSPAARAPDPRDTLARSKVFPRFLAAVGHQPSPVILDLGPVVGSNIAFFGDRLSCKIFIEDLCADVETFARSGRREDLASALVARLAREAGGVDGIICWDIFDYLDGPTGLAVARQLVAQLRSGGALYGVFGATAIAVSHYSRFTVEADDALRIRPYPATPTRRTVRHTRDVTRMFEGLTVAESVLLKNNARETLFRKP